MSAISPRCGQQRSAITERNGNEDDLLIKTAEWWRSENWQCKLGQRRWERLWNIGCLQTNTKEHAWMCHHCCFGNMLPRTMTSVQHRDWWWKLAPPLQPRNETTDHWMAPHGICKKEEGQNSLSSRMLRKHIDWFSPERGSGGIAPRILDSRHWMEVSGQIHTPAALPPRKEPLVLTG
jgi:hypothetical protein